jgi:hypothetical protein
MPESMRSALLLKIAELAREQRGVVSRAQLRALGCGDTWISARVREGVLQRVFPQVFAFGDAELTREGRWFAAVLAGGEDAALSHRSAAAFWGLIRMDAGRPDIIIAANRGLTIDDIHPHRCKLAEGDVLEIDGLRVTSPMRTLIDLADVVSQSDLADAFDQALLHELYDKGPLDELLARACGRRGLKKLKRVTAELTDEGEVFLSRRERQARDILVAHGVGRPSVNTAVAIGAGRYRYPDLYFAKERVDVEIDGPHHRLAHRRRKDAIRDRELAGVGVLVDRYPDTLLDTDPSGFARRVAATLERRRAALRAAA